MKVSGFCGGAMAVVLFCEYIVIAIRCDPRNCRRTVRDAYGDRGRMVGKRAVGRWRCDGPVGGSQDRGLFVYGWKSCNVVLMAERL